MNDYTGIKGGKPGIFSAHGQMQEIIIDDEFRLLLPPLDKVTYAWLEENILTHGCREPLVLWNGILIDGYNRYEISTKHDIPFNTVAMEFDSRDNVLIWIVSTQVARRNLTPFQLSYYRGLHYNADKRVLKNEGGRNQFSERNEVKVQKEPKPLDNSTATRLAAQYNVSRSTIKRDSQLAEAIFAIGITSPAAKRDILAGKARVSRKKLRELSAGPEENVVEAAGEIENGTFEEKKPEPVEIQPLEKEFKRITDDFYSELRNLTRNGDTEALRLAFKSYIERLEDMFSHSMGL